ncbi:hypothetical protein GCM10023342_27640 [Modicisalibacter zincidurans]|uniref:Uncharacterized protein n=1 Tax=Modicisalibacter zincidurans TaxID=1178777 RepID=A0ABP9RJU0_9GAMM
MRQQATPGIVELEPAAQPFEQHHLQLTLEITQRLTGRRLRKAELPGRCAHRTAPRHSDEYLKLAKGHMRRHISST